MGKLTKEKIAAIVNRYNQLLSYTEVGKEFGVNWITVKRHVEADKQQKTTKDPSTDSAEVQSTTAIKDGKGKFAQAVQLFKRGKSLTDAVIELDLSYEEAVKYWEDYCRMAWVRYAPRFFALEDHHQVNLIMLQDCMKNEGMDPKSYVTRLRKDYNSLDEVTWKVNQLSVKSRELTEEIDLKHEELYAIEDQINSKRERLQELQDASQEMLVHIENNKKEADHAKRTIGELNVQKQQLTSELERVKRELDELLDPNGPKAAALKILVGTEVGKALHNSDMMLSASLVAVIGAIRSDELTLNALNTISSLASPPDAVKFASHVSPYLKKLYNEQAQYLRTRFVDMIMTDQYDEIRRKSKDPQYRAVRQ